METEVNNEVVEVANDTTDYKALYEETKAEADAKAQKVGELEGLIQKHKDKKTVKAEAPSDNPSLGKEDLEKMLNEREFYKNNPELSEHKEVIEKYTSNGTISLEQAKTLVLQGDPTIQARQNTSQSNFTDGVNGTGTMTYSQEDLQKMPRDLKMKALRDIQAGKAIETL